MNWHRLLTDRSVAALLAQAGMSSADRTRVRGDSPLFATTSRSEPTVHFAFASDSGVCGQVARAVWNALIAGMPGAPVFAGPSEEYWAEFVGGLTGRMMNLWDGAFRLWARAIVVTAYANAKPQSKVDMNASTKREFVEQVCRLYLERTGFALDSCSEDRKVKLFEQKLFVGIEETLREFLKADLVAKFGGAA